MILLLRGLARLVTFLLALALAITGAAAALFSVQGGDGDLSLSGLARLVGLPELREQVGELLAAVEQPGSVALYSALGGVAALAAGVLLLIGALWPRRERLVVLARGEDGVLAARRRALGQAATTLAEQVRGVDARRVRLRPARRGRAGGRLKLKAVHASSSAESEVRQRVVEGLEPLTAGFALDADVDLKPGKRVS